MSGLLCDQVRRNCNADHSKNNNKGNRFLGRGMGTEDSYRGGGKRERGVKIDESIRDVERKDRNGFPKVKVNKI